MRKEKTFVRIFGMLLCSVFMVCIPSASALATVVTVPFTWEVNPEVGQLAYVEVYNYIPGHFQEGTSYLLENFTVHGIHMPPPSYIERLDPLPTSVTLRITAEWSGYVDNDTFAFDPFGNSYDTYGRASGSVSVGLESYEFPTVVDGPDGSGYETYTKDFFVAAGDGAPINCYGVMRVETLCGYVPGSGYWVWADSGMFPYADLIGQTSFNIRYLVPDSQPAEPATLALLTLGSLALFRRRRG
jgi:hypothetical protein